MPASADRNLLFGILALQMDFITRDQLVAAMNAWVLAKHRPLGEILVEQQAPTKAKRDLLEPLVDQHVRDHGDDAQKSLAAISSVSSVRQQLQAVQDAEVRASLCYLSDSPERTSTFIPPPADSVRYRILRPHARGGLGEVFVAKDTELNRDVALKEIQRGKDRTDLRSRFLLEAEITGGLEHPGIVPVYGLGHYDDGRPYYAMRFIKGDNLGDAIRKFHSGEPGASAPGANSQGHAAATGGLRHPACQYESLEFRRLLQRFIDVCNAVAYAHSRGVLHRDLKPGNIMLGKYGETLVVDWGLAKTQASREQVRPSSTEVEGTLVPSSGTDVLPTQHGSALGTPAYMSPEQAAGSLNLLGPRSDVYSLGATLYHLLVGQPPNAGLDPREVLARAQTGEAPLPRSINPAIPRALDAVCRKAMALAPDDRYISAQALADDVEHWLADEPVGACVEPLAVRAKRWMRKHPGTVAGLAATLVVGVLGLTGGLYFVNAERTRTELARRGEQEQRQEAQKQRDEANTQRTEAQKQRDEAQRQRDETEAVLKFVEDKVFAAARPETYPGGLGHDVPLKRAVEAALPFVAEGFKTQPLTEARLRMTLGTSFWYLGRADIAVRENLRARELYTAHRGPDHPDTLTGMSNLANSYAALGRHPEALALNEETLKLRKAKLGPDHPDTLASMNNLANIYANFGRHPAALALREETLRLRKAKLGPDHPNSLTSMHNLANSYADLGRHPEALALREETLKLQKAKLGPDHPDTLASMNDLANSYADLGRHPEALALREETLKLRKAKLGPDHPDTLTSMHNLSNSYAALGRHTEALGLREETLKLRKAKLGPDHPDTLTSMHNLSNSYAALGRHTEALGLREETLKLQKAKLGPDHPDTLTSMHNLSNSYAALDRHPEALALQEETLKLQKAKLGPDHPNTFTSMNNLANSYAALGRHPEALALREETLKLRKAKLPPDHPDTLKSMNDLAVSYTALGRHPEALALREETLKLQKAKLGPDHPETLTSMNNLAVSYTALGRHPEALALDEETLKLQKAKLGPDHPNTLTSMHNLVVSYVNLGRHPEALALCEETLKLRKAKLGSDRPDTLSSMNSLAVSYANLGRHPEALALHEETLKLQKAKLGPDHPGTLRSMNNLANSYADLGRHPEALALYEETLKLRKAKLGPDHPDTLNSFWGVIESLIELKRFDEASPYIEEAFAQIQSAAAKRLRVSPRLVPALWSFRFRIAREKADSAGCRAAAEQFEQLQLADAGNLYKAAGFRAVLAGLDPKGDDADKAMARLTKAVAAGYKNLPHMKQDKDLAALHDRDDFKKLIADLEAKVAADKKAAAAEKKPADAPKSP